MSNNNSLRRAFSGIGLAGALLLCSCAQPVDLDEREAATAFAILDSLSQTIGGTPEQRKAGEILQYHAYQDPLRDCMKKAGFVYSPPPFVNPYEGMPVIHMGIGTGGWLAPLDSEKIGVADAAARIVTEDAVEKNPSYDNLSSADKEKYDDALTRCTPREMQDAHFPPTSMKLSSAFVEMLADATKDPRVKSSAKAYALCMAKGGHAVKNNDELIKEMQERISKVRAPKPGTAQSPEWAAVVDEEKRAAQLDAECRRPTYEIALGLASEKLDDFEETHAEDLRLVSQEWTDMVNRAKQHPEF